jgi:hypothetical protein
VKPAINDSFIQNLVTFFSIAFGFYVSSATILYGSNLSSKLAKIIDPKIKFQTKLHTIRNYLYTSCCLCLFTLAVTFLYSYVVPSSNGVHVVYGITKLWSVELIYDNIFSALLLSICVVNFSMLCMALKIFFVGFVEASQK